MRQPDRTGVADHLAALEQATIKPVAMTPVSYGLVGRVKLNLPLVTTRF